MKYNYKKEIDYFFRIFSKGKEGLSGKVYVASRPIEKQKKKITPRRNRQE